MWIFAVMLMSVGPVGPGGGIYSIIEDVVYKVYYKETDLEAKQSWIYAVLLMSVGPEVGYIQLLRMLSR